jgi:hypothetical protein
LNKEAVMTADAVLEPMAEAGETEDAVEPDDVEYSFEGFTIEFSERILLLPSTSQRS